MEMALRNPIFRAKIEMEMDEIPTRYFEIVVRRYESSFLKLRLPESILLHHPNY
jgi:hypothetical protein